MCGGFVFVRAISIVIGIGISKIDILSVRNSLILPAKNSLTHIKRTNTVCISTLPHKPHRATPPPHSTAMKASHKQSQKPRKTVGVSRLFFETAAIWLLLTINCLLRVQNGVHKIRIRHTKFSPCSLIPLEEITDNNFSPSNPLTDTHPLRQTNIRLCCFYCCCCCCCCYCWH